MSWMVKTIAGIDLLEGKCGDGIFEIKPYFFEDLTYATCTWNSNFGEISVSWKKNETHVELEVTLGEGVKAYYDGTLLPAGKHCFKI